MIFFPYTSNRGMYKITVAMNARYTVLRTQLLQFLQAKDPSSIEKVLNQINKEIPLDKLPQQDREFLQKAKEMVEKLKSNNSMKFKINTHREI